MTSGNSTNVASTSNRAADQERARREIDWFLNRDNSSFALDRFGGLDGVARQITRRWKTAGLAWPDGELAADIADIYGEPLGVVEMAIAREAQGAELPEPKPSAKAATPAKKPAAKPAPPPPAAAKDNRSLFARHAPGLIEKGYSPVPRNAGKGRTDRPGWSDFCGRQASPEELREWLRIPGADIVLACGFGGLVAVDVDDTRPEILDAVRGALPHCTVARFGSKGFALLCRHVDGPQHMGSIYAADEQRKSPLVELMGLGRVITVPPSRHAKTGKSYLWIDPATGEPRADDWGLPPLHELPAIDDSDLQRLREALAPWSRKPKPPRPLPEGPAPVLNSASEKRYRAYALKGLNDAAATLAGLSEGRPSELFRAVCSLGWAVAHGVLSEVEFTAAFANACQQNGLVSRNGRHAIEASIRSGLGRAENDPLHVFAEREPGKAARGRAAPQRKASPVPLDKAASVSDAPEPPPDEEWQSRMGPPVAMGSSKALVAQPAAKGVPDEWDEPEPLVEPIERAPYPVEALPDGMREAVEEAAAYMRCPPEVAAASALSVLSIAGQGIANVYRDQRLNGPVSIFSLAILDSGERKSAIDKLFSEPLLSYQKETQDALEPSIKTFLASMAGWRAKYAGVTKAIEQEAKGAKKKCDDLDRVLRDLQATEPLAPRIPNFIYENTTLEAMLWGLHSKWPSAALLSAEAGTIFGGHSMRPEGLMLNLAAINALWDGKQHPVNRRTSESYLLDGARLTIGLAAQPEVVRQFLEKTNGLARGSGFLARFLLLCPKSMAGSRPYMEEPEWRHLDGYNARIAMLLRNAPQPETKTGKIAFVKLGFSSASKALWIKFYDDCEASMKPGNDFSNLKDIASKAPENAARLAALFHLYTNGPDGEIEKEEVEQAAAIIEWHLLEARHFLSAAAVPPGRRNAVALDEWLVARCREAGVSKIPSRDLLRLGPNPVREVKARDNALAELEALDRARQVSEGRKKWVAVNPKLLGGGGE